MKSLFTVAALGIFLPVLAQNNFVQITPGGPLGQYRIDDVFFTSAQLGFACDQGGKIRKITNNGATIEQIYSGQGNLRSIEFFNPDNGFVGRLLNSNSSLQPLLRTTNGGENWEEVELDPLMPGICGLHALDNGTIYACGAYFGPAYYFKSTDYGNTWNYSDMSAHAEGMVDVFFINDSLGFMGGQSTNGAILLKTEDAGETWETVYESTIPTDYIWKIHQMEVNSSVLYAALQSEAGPESVDYIWSEDGGDSWEAGHATEYGDTQDLIFIDPDTAFITGQIPLPLHRSVDGGISWEVVGDALNGNRFFAVDSANIYLSGSHLHKYGGLSTSLSTSQAMHTTRVKVFPNPAKKEFTIEAISLYSDHIIVSLLDSQGKYLSTLGKSNLNPAANQINLSLPQNLSSGVYLLHIHTHSGVQIERLIVE